MQIMDLEIRTYFMMVKVRSSAGSYCVSNIPDHYKLLSKFFFFFCNVVVCSF